MSFFSDINICGEQLRQLLVDITILFHTVHVCTHQPSRLNMEPTISLFTDLHIRVNLKFICLSACLFTLSKHIASFSVWQHSMHHLIISVHPITSSIIIE